MKRRISTLMALALLVVPAIAQTNFFEGTWKEAAAEAAAQNKYLFIDCYTDWCGWCKVADKETFATKQVGDFLNESFISVKVDMERDEGVYLGMKYRVSGYPSYLMFSPDGSFAHKMTGYMKDNTDFIVEVKKSLDTINRPNYPSKLTDFVGFPDFYKKSFIHKDSDQKKRIWPEDAEVRRWLEDEADYTAEDVWSVMFKFNLENKPRAYFLANLDKFSAKYGHAEVQEKVGAMAYDNLKKAMETKEFDDLTIALEFADQYLDQDMGDIKSYYKLKFFEAKEDWHEYLHAAQEIIDKKGFEKNLDDINDYCWTIYLHSDDKDALYKAEQWIAKVTQLETSYFYLDTYAAILYKRGNYEKALGAAEKALIVGKETGQEMDETIELQEKIKAALAEK